MQESVSQIELAEILGVTPKSVRAWERQGMPVQEKGRRGVASKYSVAACIAWRLERVEAQARARPDPTEIDEARARKVAAEAALAEIELAKARGEVVRLDDMSRAVGEALATTRARLLQVGAKCAPQADLQPDEATLRALLDDALHEAIEPISGDVMDIVDMAAAPG